MEQYIYVKNYNKLGTMAISRSVCNEIVNIVCETVMKHSENQNGQKKIQVINPARATIKNGQVCIQIDVSIAWGENVTLCCKMLQEEVANVLTALTEMVAFKIDIRVLSIK